LSNEQTMEYTGENKLYLGLPKYTPLLDKEKKEGKIWLIFQYMWISTLISPM